MTKGQFPNYEVFKKAHTLNISLYDEYQFMLEQIELEKSR
jgi:hypothetical protein